LDVLASLLDYANEHASIEIESSLKAMKASLKTELPPELMDDMSKAAIINLTADSPDFEISKYALEHALEQGYFYYIRLDLEQIDQRELTPLQLVDEMISMGEILDSGIIYQAGISGMDQNTVDAFGFLYATKLEQDLLQAALHLDQLVLRQLGTKDFKFNQVQAPENNIEEKVRPPAITGSGESKVEHAEAARKPPLAQAGPHPADGQKQTTFYNLAETQEEEDDSPGHEYITFTLSHENYGLDILLVQEIIALPRLTRLPRSPMHVLGVMNLRGMVVPVVDMRLRLNLPTDSDIDPVVMVVKTGSKFMGAVVDSVSDVVEFKDSEIQDPPDFAVAVHKEYLRGLCRQNDDLVVILDVDQILAPESQTSG
jgi:purine-binding chemotaxis protein CheW